MRGRNDLLLLCADDLINGMLTEVGAIVIHVVAEKGSTFARTNVFAEVLRQIHGVRFASGCVLVSRRVAAVNNPLG